MSSEAGLFVRVGRKLLFDEGNPPRLVLANRLICAVGVILSITALVKFITVFGNPKYLSLSDPLLWFLTNRQVLISAGSVELGVAGVIFFGSNPTTKAFALSWLSALIVSYRAALYIIKPGVPCKCLGHVTEWLQISPATADAISKGLLTFILLSCVFYCLEIRRWKPRNDAGFQANL